MSLETEGEPGKGTEAPQFIYKGEISAALAEKLHPNAVRSRALGIALIGMSNDELASALAINQALLEVALLSAKLLGSRIDSGDATFDLFIAAAEHMDSFAKRGKKVIEGAAKGHAAVHGTSAQKEERAKRYQAAANAFIETNGALSWSAVCQKVGERFDVSAKTISRHAVDPRT